MHNVRITARHAGSSRHSLVCSANIFAGNTRHPTLSGQQIDEDQTIVILAQAGFADCVIARILATCAGIQKERIGRSGANQGAPAHVTVVSECLIPKSTTAPATSLATTVPRPISDSPGSKKGLMTFMV